jgi:catechol 2,3-dioxygenase-like lactoylglutathione lyase family enzyme
MSTPQSPPITMALEVVVIPVSNVDRAMAFYRKLGWRLDADITVGEDFRLVQFTPPGSACSIHFGSGVTHATPGSEDGLYLVVADIEEARKELKERSVKVSEVFHRSPGKKELVGADPQRQSYASFISFSDPDGNSWLIQEVTARLPGRIEPEAASFASAAALAGALRRAAAAHGEHEKQIGQPDANWPDWYAQFIVSETPKLMS